MLKYSFSFNSQILCSAYLQVSEVHPQNSIQRNVIWQRKWTLPKQSLTPAVPYFGKENLLTLGLEMKAQSSKICSFVYYCSVGHNKGHTLSVLNYLQNVTAMLYSVHINGELPQKKQKKTKQKKETAALISQYNYSQLDITFCLNISSYSQRGKGIRDLSFSTLTLVSRNGK